MRGYFGIGIVGGKTSANVALLMRSAYCFGASFVFTVGDRYRRMAPDTTATARHVPLFHYQDTADLLSHTPQGCARVAVEIREDAVDIGCFQHPERAIYLLGPEDNSLSEDVIAACESVIYIPTAFCLNVAIAGSVVLFHRQLNRREAKDTDFMPEGWRPYLNDKSKE